ncbi:DUF4381 domain-containing protein [Microbulbifer rhizosphaerae]|uniref:DUF4381 domain-containing protein n=1 Tax=Microbulbifer rhizosphaerae TaxID=1562603 RepID=A0A7W4WD01_9GAMM|nr:DUF4381 domain-containing protein [Microbulbifer rhizosphaerae]MBB3061477.1 hypothetical protein [Microbulbifer rhizosphaerae]
MQQAQPSPQLSKEAQELLAQLRDIHEPAPVGWWPPAPGWWLLGALILTAVAAAIFFWHRRRKIRARNRYRVEAVRLLQDVAPANPRAVEQINEILKRVAVASFGRPACGNLTGRRWIEFLENSSDSELPAEAREALLEHLYRRPDKNPEWDQKLRDCTVALRDCAIQWVESHQREAAGV